LSSTAIRSYSQSSIQKRQYQLRFQPASFIAVRIIHIPGISIHMPGILIHILPESLFTSPRNRYSHAPEYAADALRGSELKQRGNRRGMSAAARRKISLAQKARWAKQKAKPRRAMSAAGRKRIAAAQRARWAKVKAQRKKAA
jgi:hypothetical protein